MIYESPFEPVHLPECSVWDKGERARRFPLLADCPRLREIFGR